MIKLLERTRSHIKSTKEASLYEPSSTSFIHHDALVHDFDIPPRRRATAAARPRTADDGIRHSKAARMSFFEAFAIDACDEETFSFPKPLSAKTVPKGIQILASVAESREASPLIGVAYGSPSHPPQYWSESSGLGPSSANVTPRTPRLMESLPGDNRPEDEEQSKAMPTWKRMGSLFRRSTKSKKQKMSADPETATPTPSTLHRSPRPKSRGRSLLSVGRKSGEMLRQQPETEPSLQIPPSWLNWQSSPKIGSPLRKTHQSRPSKVSRVLDADDATLRISIAPTHETSLIAKPVISSVPRLELQLPSVQLERYSIMFEKVLDPKPSLLERRKSRLRLLDAPTDINETTDTTRLSPLFAVDINTRDRRPLGRSATSPSLSPSHLLQSTIRTGQQNRAVAFHKPLALRRSNTAPILSISPLRQSFIATSMTPDLPADSPLSADDTASFPYTPPLSEGAIDTSIHVFNDTLPSFRVTAYEDSISNVWQSALPLPPNSSTSSRFSIDVHKALDSPRLLSRSHSFNGRDSAVRPNGRQVQVAVARRIDIAAGDGRQSGGHFKPKVIQVGAQAHLRKSSVLETAH